MKLTRLSLVAVIGALLVACAEGKYSGLSTAELAEKKRHCDSIPKKSAVFANGCEQVSKEIATRSKKT